ncbi:unnamed protein product [Anisakis simplex]|uniref:Secreted protein n=1 Tax=Anisakis simplex TaxID=6269 RepID=A0A0M3JDW2_ANISI|nr:unnamed protein product [Anisakis simplex]
MPTASIRKRVYGLIRTTFSPGTSLDASAPAASDAVDHEHSNGSDTSSVTMLPSTSNSFISQCILTGY